jgi:hypothetical protein
MKHITAMICCAMICAASAFCADPITTKPAFQTLQSQGGRYAFGQVSDWNSDKYMLDTQTGKLWVMVTFENGAKELRPVVYQFGESLCISPPDYSTPPPSVKK